MTSGTEGAYDCKCESNDGQGHVLEIVRVQDPNQIWAVEKCESNAVGNLGALIVTQARVDSLEA